MHSITLLLAGCLLPMVAGAQLINGSFEDGNGDPLITPWQHTCPVSSGDPAPPGGNWGVQIEHGNFQGCFPGYVYQTLPTVNDGDVYTLIAYARNAPSSGVFLPVGIALGKIDATGTITHGTGPANATDSWVQMSVTDTFHLAPGDTALVLLLAGQTSGPATGYAQFDAAALNWQGGDFIPTVAAPAEMRFVLEGSTAVIHFARRSTGRMRIFDALGREVLQWPVVSTTLVRIPIDGLRSGTYLVRADRAEGSCGARFIVP
ncbi:MAG: hypothetical protein H6595_13845 [Flavobacteriales bacterium]|nr:hypothetical protein [Flavobacteriales bacterium]